MKRVSPVHTIAVFRALKLGDMLCATPAFRALRKAFPTAHITLIGLPWAETFVKRFNYFDDFIPFPGYPGLAEQPYHPRKFSQFLKTVQGNHYDIVLQMHGNGSIVNTIIPKFQAKEIAGFYHPGQYCPNRRTFLPYPLHEHEIRRHLRLLQFLGIPLAGEELDFPMFAEDYTRTRKLFDIDKQYMIVHPGGISAKKWHAEKFAKVADVLAQEDYTILITGSTDERTLAKTVASYMQAKPIILAGKTDLGTLGVLVKHACVVISNDTSISHITAALKTPSVIIYTTSDPTQWAPLDKELHKVILAKEARPAAVAETTLHQFNNELRCLNSKNFATLSSDE